MSDSLAVILVICSVLLAFLAMYVTFKTIDKRNYSNLAELKATWGIGLMVLPLATVSVVFYFKAGIAQAIATMVIGLVVISLNYGRLLGFAKLEQDLKKSPFKREKLPERNSPCPCGTGLKYKHCCGKNNGVYRG